MALLKRNGLGGEIPALTVGPGASARPPLLTVWTRVINRSSYRTRDAGYIPA